MNKKYLKNVQNFFVAGTSPSRRFWVGLRLSVAVTFLSCLLVFALAGIHRADSQSNVAAIGDDSDIPETNRSRRWHRCGNRIQLPTR